jgi:outer membrane cobalamin receptor
VAGIQTQQLSASTGNTEMRVQGLPGKYTQILKDGMPLFGGYAGSFSILQIPPLDLKQIEIIKGASSTLYGGGAIAGIINLVSKRPKQGVFEKTFLVNGSTLKETNLNVYLSNRNHKTGFTFFTGINRQVEVDVNKDGFSDVPDIKGIFFHPVLFLYPNDNNMISVGYNGVYEKRKGGDMQVLNGRKDQQHQYFVFNESFRNSAEINWEHKINSKDRLNAKGTTSWLNRDIETNKFGMGARQVSWFTEINYLKRFTKHDVVTGLNVLGDDFRKKRPDSSLINPHTYSTFGLFIQDDWRITNKLTLQSGLRIDCHNKYGEFILPRISFMYKINPYLTTWLGGGLGYKIPDAFSNEIDERDLVFYDPQYFNVRDERSQGLNWDINFHKQVSGWDLTLNQTFYITNIQYPIILHTDPGNFIFILNASQPLATHGFETYFQADHDAFEIYLGYTYTVAKKFYDPWQPYLDLSARNKFASVFAYEFTDFFRGGIEAAVTGKQYLEDGTQTPGFIFMAAMLRFDAGHFAFVLNCENLLDYRQSKKEIIVLPPYNNPRFRQLWAPIDGRIVNFSIRAKF